MGEGGGGEEFLSFSSLPFSLPSFPFSPETPDTQAMVGSTFGSAAGRFRGNTGPCRFFPGRNHPLAHLIHEVQFVSKLF